MKCLALLVLCALRYSSICAGDDVMSLMHQLRVTTDLNISPPKYNLKVSYSEGIQVDGKELSLDQVRDKPLTLEWVTEGKQHVYLMAMVDPDALSSVEHGSFLHWMVGNIRDNLADGEQIVDYMSARPPKGTGFHRYVFLVFKQEGKCDFEKLQKRSNFHLDLFVRKYGLQGPVAGTFFRAKNSS